MTAATSASPPSTASINRPVLLALSAHGSAKDRNCALASTIRLTMANRSKVLRASGGDPHRPPPHLLRPRPVAFLPHPAPSYRINHDCDDDEFCWGT